MRKPALLLALAASAGLLLSLPSHAADRNGNFAIKGVGLAPCTDFLESFRAGDARLPMFLGWVSGFLSAMNLHSPDTYDLVDWQSDDYIAASLRGWCEANPSERFFSGVYQMARSLEAFRVSAQSPAVIMEGPQGKIRLYRSTLDKVRAELETRGLYDEAAHGREAFAMALKAYQRREGLPETGVPDTATLFRLFAAK